MTWLYVATAVAAVLLAWWWLGFIAEPVLAEARRADPEPDAAGLRDIYDSTR